MTAPLLWKGFHEPEQQAALLPLAPAAHTCFRTPAAAVLAAGDSKATPGHRQLQRQPHHPLAAAGRTVKAVLATAGRQLRTGHGGNGLQRPCWCNAPLQQRPMAPQPRRSEPLPPAPKPALPPEALPLAQALVDALRIDDRQWHALKSNRRHRAAEQLAAGLSQLLHGHDAAAAARLEAALGWLRGELRDPGCPRH